ncbi:MAG: Gfo/Idh/MocA family protein, partial [Opitutaceae bacterium]
HRRMKQTYRAVLAGTGGIGDTHARAVQSTQGRVELVAAMDVDAARAAAFTAKWGIAGTFTNYTEMLAATRPDLVIIASPPALHLGMSVAAMEAGAWVWCEKPLCGSLADLDVLAAATSSTRAWVAWTARAWVSPMPPVPARTAR